MVFALRAHFVRPNSLPANLSNPHRFAIVAFHSPPDPTDTARPALGGPCCIWRRGWDSNPRYGDPVHLISSQARSTTPAPLQDSVVEGDYSPMGALLWRLFCLALLYLSLTIERSGRWFVLPVRTGHIRKNSGRNNSNYSPTDMQLKKRTRHVLDIRRIGDTPGP